MAKICNVNTCITTNRKDCYLWMTKYKNKKPGFITSIRTGRGITGTTRQRYKKMNRKAIEKIISIERLEPYLNHHSNNFELAVAHYKANIEVSESFYSLLAILEIGLRNNIDYQLKRRFNDNLWYENADFINIVSRFQIDRVSEARNSILREKKTITTGKVISELSFGFWTSLLDSKFEKLYGKVYDLPSQTVLRILGKEKQ